MGVTDSTLADQRSLDQADLADVTRSLSSRFGSERLRRAIDDAAVDGDRADPWEAGLIRATSLPTGQPISPLWFGLYPSSVTLLVGETGAGKSSLIYNVALHAGRNETLFGIAFGLGRPVRVLLVDPENAGNYRAEPLTGGLCAERIRRIGVKPTDELWFHDGLNVDLSAEADCAALAKLAEQRSFDLIILDTIGALFRTEDENDNAEASQQMNALRELARTTGAAVIAVHHTGKGEANGAGLVAHYGRGASARLALADVGMILRARGPWEDDDTYGREHGPRSDVCRLHIAKDRLGFFGRVSVYLSMRGNDRFELATFDDWRGAPTGSRARVTSKQEQARTAILDALGATDSLCRQEILLMTKRLGIGGSSTDDALKTLVAADQISCSRGPHGATTYRLHGGPFA